MLPAKVVLLSLLSFPVTPGARNSGLDWRTPQIRDAARERDATTLGAAHAPGVSTIGVALAGLGAGGSAAGLVGRGKERTLGLAAFSPTLCAGGAGVRFTMRW